MEDAVAVHVVHGLNELVHVALHAILCHVMPPATNELVDVHVHELKDKCEAASGLIAVGAV